MRLEPCRAPGGRQRAPGVRPSISIQRFVLSLVAPKPLLGRLSGLAHARRMFISEGHVLRVFRPPHCQYLTCQVCSVALSPPGNLRCLFRRPLSCLMLRWGLSLPPGLCLRLRDAQGSDCAQHHRAFAQHYFPLLRSLQQTWLLGWETVPLVAG